MLGLVAAAQPIVIKNISTGSPSWIPVVTGFGGVVVGQVISIGHDKRKDKLALKREEIRRQREHEQNVTRQQEERVVGCLLAANRLYSDLMTAATNPSQSVPSDTDFYVSLTAIETFGPDELLGVGRELGMKLVDLKFEVNEYRTINHGKADLDGVSATVRSQKDAFAEAMRGLFQL